MRNFRNIFLLFISFTFTVEAQSGLSELKKMQNKFKNITDFTANLSQKFQSGKGNGNLNGVLYYKRKNKFFVDLGNRIVVSNGETIWNYDKRYKRVVISYLADDPTSFSIERYIFDYPPLCNVRLVKDSENQDLNVIELVPKDDDLDFKLVRIWKTNDNFISKLELLDLAGMKYLFEFTDVKFNQNLVENRFNFYPPKGIQIIDLR